MLYVVQLLKQWGRTWLGTLYKRLLGMDRVVIRNISYSTILFICSFHMIHGEVQGCFCCIDFYPRMVCPVWTVHCRSKRYEKKTQTLYKTVMKSLSLDSTSTAWRAFLIPCWIKFRQSLENFFFCIFLIFLGLLIILGEFLPMPPLIFSDMWGCVQWLQACV